MSDYHICMLGPSRSGKTTLLASVINDFMKLSEDISQKDDEYLKLVPKGETKARVNKSIDAIKISTQNGEFVGSGLAGTVDHTIFDVDLSYQKKALINSDPDFKLHFHDFPGGWIKTGDGRMNDVKFEQAHILLMPVDASLMFEAARPPHKASAAMQLELESLLEVAKAWAHARKADKDHPGLFILVPVKCETYFNDNLPVGLNIDNSSLLKKKVLDDYFKEIIGEIHKINPATQALYMPVDTIGCCFINDRKWKPSEEYGYQLWAQYKIPDGMKWTPFGSAHIMLKIIEYLINDNERNKGFFDKLLDFVGWNTDLGKKVRKMRGSDSCAKYTRGHELW